MHRFQLAVTFTACAAAMSLASAAPSPLTEWPTLASAIPPDPALEAKVAAIVANMSLEQKVGQITGGARDADAQRCEALK